MGIALNRLLACDISWLIIVQVKSTSQEIKFVCYANSVAFLK